MMATITLYIVMLIAVCVGYIGVYFLVLKIVKDQYEKTLPAQITSLRKLIGDKPFRMVIDIKTDGTTEIKDFRQIDKPSYLG